MTTKQMLGVGDADGTLRLAYSMEKMREQFNKQHLLEASGEIFNMSKFFRAGPYTFGKQQDLSIKAGR